MSKAKIDRNLMGQALGLAGLLGVNLFSGAAQSKTANEASYFSPVAGMYFSDGLAMVALASL